jgi:hypothetical protein
MQGESTMTLGWLVFYAGALYVAVGLVVAVAFVSYGASRALPEPIPLSLGARILIFPGSTLLWPVVLRRWLRAGKHA